MENLSQTVYECTLAVEAHMICDLLARGGVSARVDGEFLAGAGGDLPLGNTIKVRVDPARAAEAREIIADWEKLQPADPTPPPVRSKSHSALWFVAGLIIGGAATYLVLNMETRVSTADRDGDGVDDETYHYVGETIRSIDIDSNADRKIDARWTNDSHGEARLFESDDDFDGRFDRRNVYENGWMTTTTIDEDGDGHPDMVTHFGKTMAHSAEIYDAAGTRVVARQKFTDGWHTSTDLDLDGDGTFERHVEFDRYGVPR